MINKILRLKEFGSFNDFSSDTKLKNFQKYNLIFGLNGTGKTTLSRFFNCLNKGEIIDKIQEPNYKENFDILLDDNQHIKTFNTNLYKNKIKVFNNDFITDNLKLDSHNASTQVLSYSIGEKSIEIKAEIDKIKNENSKFFINNDIEKDKQIDVEIQKIIDKIEQLQRDISYNIRCDLRMNPQKYTITHFKNDLELNKSQNLINISEDDKNKYAQVYFSPQKDKINKIKFQTISDITINKLKNILSLEIKRGNLKEELASWLEQGIKYVNDEKCPMCNNPLHNWQERYNEVRQLIKKDDAFLEFEIEIKNIEQELKLLIEVTEKNKIDLRITDFSCDISEKNLNDYKNAFNDYKLFLNKLLEQVQLKQTSTDKLIIINNTEFLNKYIEQLDKINLFIENHNNIISDIENEKEKARNHVISYYIAKYKNIILSDETTLEQLKIQKVQIDKIIENNNKTLQDLYNQLSNQKAPIDEIKKYISRITMNDNINLTYDEIKKEYYVRRKDGSLANNLSEGEKTIIAFSYFLATLKEEKFNLKESIVLIDDPVSSLDQQYLFNVLNLLMHIFDNRKDFKQLFLLTHNFYFFKKIRAIIMNKDKQRSNEKEPNPIYEIFEIAKNKTSYIKNGDKYLRSFESEYTYTIKFLRDILKKDEEEIKEIPIGNSIRKILEIFLAFRCPKERTIFQRYEKIMSEPNLQEIKHRFKYLQDIANASSHTEESQDLDVMEEFKLFVGKDEINQLFEFIKLVDEKHFNNLPS